MSHSLAVAHGVTRRQARFAGDYSGAALVLPLAAFSTFAVFVPLALMLVKSLNPTGTEIGLQLYREIFQDGYVLRVLFSTIELGFVTTVAAAVISYPVAIAYVLARPTQRALIIFLVILPLLSSSPVRAFAWIVLMGREGPINDVLLWAGLIDRPLDMLFTHGAVIVAVTQLELPLMILPLATCLVQIDPNLLSASRSLGAGYWRSFRKITLPLSLPGLMAGCALVFASSISSFITQAVIGGGKRMYMPLLVYQRALSLNDFQSASALAIVLLLLVFSAIVFFNALARMRRSI